MGFCKYETIFFGLSSDFKNLPVSYKTLESKSITPFSSERIISLLNFLQFNKIYSLFGRIFLIIVGKRTKAEHYLAKLSAWGRLSKIPEDLNISIATFSDIPRIRPVESKSKKSDSLSV